MAGGSRGSTRTRSVHPAHLLDGGVARTDGVATGHVEVVWGVDNHALHFGAAIPYSRLVHCARAIDAP